MESLEIFEGVVEGEETKVKSLEDMILESGTYWKEREEHTSDRRRGQPCK